MHVVGRAACQRHPPPARPPASCRPPHPLPVSLPTHHFLRCTKWHTSHAAHHTPHVCMCACVHVCTCAAARAVAGGGGSTTARRRVPRPESSANFAGWQSCSPLVSTLSSLYRTISFRRRLSTSTRAGPPRGGKPRGPAWRAVPAVSARRRTPSGSQPASQAGARAARERGQAHAGPGRPGSMAERQRKGRT